MPLDFSKPFYGADPDTLRAQGIDPEEHDQPSDTQSNFQSAGPNTYVTLRFNLKY